MTPALVLELFFAGLICGGLAVAMTARYKR
jgi:hypothetical protein